MKRILTCYLLVTGLLSATELLPFMPRPADYSAMWWRDGFPGRVAGAPWHRCIQSGHYGFILDTETLQIPHLGSPNLSNAHTPAELALQMQVNGKTYTCKGAAAWSRFTGPRIIASGPLLQRADITYLSFVAEDGDLLNVEAQLETIAWPDRLALVLNARPGIEAIRPGQDAFGKVGGGYGLNGENSLRIPHRPELDPAVFTVALWAYVPIDYRAGSHSPWLLCKNHHEAHPGNFGITIQDDRPVAHLNIDGHYSVSGRRLRLGAWNHLAISYDGQVLRLHQNYHPTGEELIDRPRMPGAEALILGQRGNDARYRFRGIIDELQIFDCALDARELRSNEIEPVAIWNFREDGVAAHSQARESWSDARMSIRLGDMLGESELTGNWSHAHVLAFGAEESPVQVQTDTPHSYDAARGWHHVDLNPLRTLVPGDRPNDAIERLPFTLHNPSDKPQVARVLFAKSAIRHRFGVPITGVTAMLRSKDGQPTGIPVQLSKNWHYHPKAGVHQGQWFHGFSQVHLPAGSSIDLELTLAYGHWGGVAAASHAQLSLIGWGSNQLWEQSAIGSWGESICYEPDQIQGDCSILDVRPLMVRTPQLGREWHWTANVGGADYFRIFAPDGERLRHRAVRPNYQRQGPCLSEVTYGGNIAQAARFAATVSLGRSDDLVRGSYRLDLTVDAPLDFSRAVLFQLGSDRYNHNHEAQIAIGDANGLRKTWAREANSEPRLCAGEAPWVSLHQAAPREGDAGANRGMVIRSWEAVLGGKPAQPWMRDNGTVDIVPPPGCTRLQPGDYLRATIEHIIVPQNAADYYGPNAGLRAALAESADSWQLIHRESAGNDHAVSMQRGKLLHRHPDIRVQADDDQVAFTVTGGLAYVPITVTNLRTPYNHQLLMDDKPVDQAVHGNDFWQTEYDPQTRSWSRSYTLPIGAAPRRIQLRP